MFTAGQVEQQAAGYVVGAPAPCGRQQVWPSLLQRRLVSFQQAGADARVSTLLAAARDQRQERPDVEAGAPQAGFAPIDHRQAILREDQILAAEVEVANAGRVLADQTLEAQQPPPELEQTQPLGRTALPAQHKPQKVMGVGVAEAAPLPPPPEEVQRLQGSPLPVAKPGEPIAAGYLQRCDATANPLQFV